MADRRHVVTAPTGWLCAVAMPVGGTFQPSALPCEERPRGADAVVMT